MPNRRVWLLPIATLFVAPAAPAGDPPQRPNVLLILIDDNDPLNYGFRGHPAAHTPNIDWIATNGVTFLNGYSAPACRPAIANILTGRYPHEHLIYNNNSPRYLPPSVCHLPNALRALGYRTFLGGKFWELSDGFSLADYGFDASEMVSAPPNQSQFVRTGQEGFLQFVCEPAGGPWFAFYCPSLPHLPVNAPDEFIQLIDINLITPPPWVPPGQIQSFRNSYRNYLGNLAWLDYELGRAMDTLNSCGQLENTLIVMLADNGWSHGYVSKQSPYEKSMSTFISFTHLGELEPRQSNALVISVDLAPTILSYVGGSGCDYSGWNLAPILRGESQTSRDMVFGDCWTLDPYPNVGIDALICQWGRGERWKYIVFHRRVSAALNAVLHWQVLYTAMPTIQPGTEQLFDLWNDPFELQDVAGNPANQDILRTMRVRTRHWHAHLSSGLLPPLVDASHPAETGVIPHP